MLGPEERFVHDLQRAQWLSAEELERQRRPVLERMLRHAATETEFYRARLAPLFGGGDPRSAAIDLTRWNEVPVLTRADVIEHGERMKARNLPPNAGAIVIRRSAGTTNRPLQFQRSTLAITAANCQLHRLYELYDFDLAGRLAHITHDATGRSAYPDGLKGKRWNFSVPEAELFTLEIRTPTADQLEWLERIKPDYVMTYPNNLRAIAETARARGGTGLRFKAFLSAGEVLEPEARETIIDTFHCRVVDIYGAREVGPIAFQCPDGDAYHLCAETVLSELLDDEWRPAAPGQYGRLVVTPLYELAMPFIRYDLGDYALTSAAPCPCGRGLPSLDRIAGRTSHLFVMPDGSRQWPSLGPISKSLTKVLAYRQIQFVQTAVDCLEVRYVPVESAAAPDVAAVSNVLRTEFRAPLEVRLFAVDRIERGAGMKVELFVSKVAK